MIDHFFLTIAAAGSAFYLGTSYGKYSAARTFLRALRESSKKGQTVREFLNDLESDESEVSDE